MTNHVHLQIESIDVEIWTIMRDVNKKYNFTGSLYDGKYKSDIIENDLYNL